MALWHNRFGGCQMAVRTIAKTRTKEMACVGCGTMLTVGSNTRKPQRCIECGVKAAIENNRQLQSRSGPYYERWRDAMLRIIGE